METLRLIDLFDPWHIPHPFVGKLSNLKQIKNLWDKEYTLVQCGKTALILDDIEINMEMRYFEKHYSWIKFFKSESELLAAESGWSFRIYLESASGTKSSRLDKHSVAPKIFEKLYVAGIIQLLEAWPYLVSKSRKNITQKVHTLVQRIRVENVKQISLVGNIQTIFWLYSALSLVSIIHILVVEIRIYIKLFNMLCTFCRWLLFNIPLSPTSRVEIYNSFFCIGNHIPRRHKTIKSRSS